MSVKFSSAQVQAIRDAGTVKGGNLVVPLAWLESLSTGRTRTSAEDRLAKFEAVLSAAPVGDDGRVTINAIAFAEAGLPTASVANPAYWSGIGDGSRMAFSKGYKSRHKAEARGGVYVIEVVLSPLSDQDREDMERRIAKADAKRAKTPDTEDDSGEAVVHSDEGETAVAK